MGFANFIKVSRKLNRMGRWATEYMTEDVRPTIASHSFTTSQIAQMLGVIEEELGNEINWKELYQKALNHDLKEGLTGDVLSHVKNRNPQIKHNIKLIEEELAKVEIIDNLPSEVQKEYTKILFNDKDDTTEGRILKAADEIDLLVECLLELERGNPEEIFFTQYLSYLKRLKDIPLKSVEYFLGTTLDEFLVNMPKIKTMTDEILGRNK